MPDDLHKKVSEWLDKEGFPLEMVVASAFRRAGLWVMQSDYYEDPNEGKQREIDVIARQQVLVARDLLRITFAVECKVSRDKPWVLFTADSIRFLDSTRVAERTASSLGKRFLSQVAGDLEIQNLPFFTLPKRPGYGLAQGLRNGSARDLR